MSNNTLKPKSDPQDCPMVAAYLLGQRHNASDLARKLGVSPNVLGNRLNPDQDFHKLGLGEAIAITELTDDNAIVDAWCQQRGGVFVKLPDHVSCDEELSDQVMLVTERMGLVMGEIRKAREDGNIDNEEFKNITAQIMKAVEEALALNALVAGQVRDLPKHPKMVISK